MSTPKSSLVKWVNESNLRNEPFGRTICGGDIPVVPLADLTALVEGLKEINAKSVIAYSIAPELSATACFEINRVSQRLLVQLEAYRKEG